MEKIQRIKIVIADDQELFRSGLRRLLEAESGFEIVDEADSGKALVSAVRYHHPDVVLTDIEMPEMDGVAATSMIMKFNPSLKVIGLSIANELYRINHLIKAGGRGYVKKSAKREELINGIRSVYANNVYYCQDSLRVVSENFMCSDRAHETIKSLGNLTEKEISIIRMICDELSARDIANLLYRSDRTIEGYRQKILDKLGVKTTAGIVKYAIQQKIYSLS